MDWRASCLSVAWLLMLSFCGIWRLVEAFCETTTLEEAVDYICWLFNDLTLLLEFKAIAFALALTEWSRALLWGPQWEDIFETVLTLSQWKYRWCLVATVVDFLLAACFVHRCKTRLGLKRRHTLQLKERWNRNLRRSRLVCKLRSKGLFFVALVHCGCGVQAMMDSSSSKLAKQDRISQSVAENMGAGSSSATASVAKSLESAADLAI